MKTQSRYEQCIIEISQEFEKNNQFVISFNNSFEFYLLKFWRFIKEKPEREEFSEQFFIYAKQLFLEGYFVVDEYINQPETESIPNDFLTQPNGLIKEQSYGILNAEQGLEDIISLDTTVPFEAWVLNNHEGTEQLLYEVKRDLIILGANFRFIKERENRKIFIKPELEERIKGILHRSDDLFFIDPQKFLACVFTNPSTEIWSIHHWSTVENEKTFGNLMIQKFLKSDLNRIYQELPIHGENKPDAVPNNYIILTLSLEQNIQENELHLICSTLLDAIVKRQNMNKKNIHLRIIKNSNIMYFQPYE